MKYHNHVLNNKCRPRDSLLLLNRIGNKKKLKKMKKIKIKSQIKIKIQIQIKKMKKNYLNSQILGGSVKKVYIIAHI